MNAEMLNEDSNPMVKSKGDELGVIDLWRDIIMRVRKLDGIQHDILQHPIRFLSIFPHEYEFERDTIVQLWMALGFLDDLSNSEEVYNVEFDALEKLEYLLPSGIDRQTGKMKYQVNHVKVMDFYQGKEGCAFFSTSSESSHASLVVDHFYDATVLYLKELSNLRTLLIFPKHGCFLKQVPCEIFTANKFLQALQLSRSHITELPSSITYLTQLRYLDVSYTLIARLPESIGSLHKLQTLKLAGCKELFELPKGFTKLISLRYLDFDILGQLRWMPKGFGALTELRTLSAFKVDNSDGCNIKELKSLNNLRGSCCIAKLENVPSHFFGELLLRNKTGLTHLQLRWYPYLREGIDSASIIEDLIPSPSLEELKVFGYPGSSLPLWMANEEFKMLGRISLLNCENLDLDIPLGELPNLKELEIIEMNSVIQMDDCFRGSDLHPIAFQKLETLVIDGMRDLETWDGIQTSDFPFLSKLVINDCPKLAALPFFPFLRSLKHLEISKCGVLDTQLHHTALMETLMVYHCPLLKKRYSKGGEDWDRIKHVQNVLIDLEDAHIEEQSIHSEDEFSSDDDIFTSDSNLDHSETEESNAGEIRDEEENDSTNNYKQLTAVSRTETLTRIQCI